MTDTTKVPEKIWAVFEPHYVKGQEPYVYASASPTRGKKYIRADLVNELIAAAYVAPQMDKDAFVSAVEALAARDKQVREEALREAAECIGHITQSEDRDAILSLIAKEDI